MSVGSPLPAPARGSHRELGPIWPIPAAELSYSYTGKHGEERDPDESQLAETVIC